MVFWIAILIGGLFAWLGVRLGFYETWILCFNIVVSIYSAILLAPLVVGFAPGTGQTAPYGMALSLIVVGGGCFAVLQGLSYAFLTGQFKIPFPRLFDIVFSGLVGFVAGFLALSFVALVVTATPVAEHRIAGMIGLTREAQNPNIVCLARGCSLVHFFVASEDAQTPQQAVDLLFAEPPGQETETGVETADPNAAPAPPSARPTGRAREDALRTASRYRRDSRRNWAGTRTSHSSLRRRICPAPRQSRTAAYSWRRCRTSRTWAWRPCGSSSALPLRIRTARICIQRSA